MRLQMRTYQAWGLLAGGLLMTLWAACQVGAASRQVDFNTQIRPILNGKCLSCHGGVKANGGLNLMYRDAALRGGDSGEPAILPGDPAAGTLMDRVLHDDPELRMPYEQPPLSEEEIDLLRRWIAQGAAWDTHWAYKTPEEPAVPASDWGENEIDAFVAAAWDGTGLRPNPEADRATLLRRLSLDLTGLPPSPAAVAAFVADRRPDAYARLVDSLLASPHYGERRAARWLDLARYADSKGYEKDPHRDSWPYRDWVIRAFNADMPFDTFTLKQLAGDLLPNPSRDELVATSFLRQAMTNTEGGTDDEEFRVAAVIDRVNTVWTVWQGTTMECVQCHDHPYDPFPQETYYQAFAFLDQTQDNDLFADYPLLDFWTGADSLAVEEALTWLAEHHPASEIDTQALQHERVRQALRPRYEPRDADDFSQVIIYPDGAAANWRNNLQSESDQPFFLLYQDIDFDEVAGLTFRYAATGGEGSLEFRLDQPDGPLLHSHVCAPTGRIRSNEGGGGEEWKSVTIDLPPQSGAHDLYVVLRNRTGNIPDGIVVLESFTLHRPRQAPSPQVVAWQDSLRRLREQAVRVPYLKARTSHNRRVTRRFERGNWLSPSDTIRPGVPEVLPGLPADAPDNRLGFAQWLVSPGNPLTARVMVNRLWEDLFGRGLVETAEDLGTQGFLPSHPELLDWLAWSLAHRHRWHLKPMLRELVMSATYRQSSEVDPAQYALDPENRLLARGVRFRLPAETIRDQALAVSGLLSPELLGPSVMPPQPEGIWKVVYSGAQWKTSEGKDRYRRALYTYWRRTSPYPSFVAFDAPSREFCVPRRIRTNTPLQALVTLNDPVYTEAATALARRMMAQPGLPAERLAYGYELALLAAPGDSSRQALQGLYEEALAHYVADSTAAITLTGADSTEAQVPELAAYTLAANALLNMDAFLTRQ
ncbi:MAG: DUF1553 domain-containing protein [Bacteroidetes bacterium]|nr:MAG: DUF1553 domain-containing protein [Bacteroidota bacterium]